MFFSKKNKSIETQQGNSILGKGAVINGDISIDGDIRIEGKILGNIYVSGKLVVGEGSEIIGDINATYVEIFGTVKGNLIIEDFLAIKGNGLVEGEIFSAKLLIEPTAFFMGVSHMTQPGNILEIKKEVVEHVN